MASLKTKLFKILELKGPVNPLSKAVNYFLIFLILVGSLSVIIETEPGLPETVLQVLLYLDYLTVAVFTLEYLLRVWVCTEESRFKHPIWGRLKYIFTFYALVDLMAILPFYLPLLIPIDLRFLRLLRLLRFARILKLTRYSEASRTLVNVFRAKKAELGVAFFSVFILVFVASGLLYVVEHEAQPEKFSSVLSSMWCTVITLTTIGYGDLFPVTVLGKILMAMIAFLGVGMFALPAGILASGFADEIKRKRVSKEIEGSDRCPHCGSELQK